MTRWGEWHDARLIALWPHHSQNECARRMKCHYTTIAHHVKLLGLPKKGNSAAYSPPPEIWRIIVRQTAREARVGAREIMGYNPSQNVVWARWTAWKRLLDEYPQYSIAGLARVSGWDHTTILHGLKRLSGEKPRGPNGRCFSRSSGRWPKLSTGIEA